MPYHESDQVQGSRTTCGAAGPACRILGAHRIPDPTTAGGFCRRFDEPAVEALRMALTETPVCVWRIEAAAFFDEAVIDADWTVADTTGGCKEGVVIDVPRPWRPVSIAAVPALDRTRGEGPSAMDSGRAAETQGCDLKGGENPFEFRFFRPF